MHPFLVSGSSIAATPFFPKRSMSIEKKNYTIKMYRRTGSKSRQVVIFCRNFVCRNFVDKRQKIDSLRFTHLSPRSHSNAAWSYPASLSIGLVEGKASMIGSLSGGDPYEIK
jgi:hypothetical protein